MSKAQFKLILPVIPKPKSGEAAVLVASGGFKGSYFTGSGGIDLHCGNCLAPVAEGMESGQIKNIVLQCPHCEAYNAVIDIPTFERFVSQLQSVSPAQKSLPKFKKILSDGLDKANPAEYVAEILESSVPEFNWFKDYLVPTDAGETYAMLGCILAFVTWYQTRPKKNKEKETPQTIVNNYFINTDPYKNVGRNDLCPCRSGKKYKHCHGSAP